MGDHDDLMYVIPPYLLNTCLGSELQRELGLIDEKLSLLNTISSDSPYYYNHWPTVKHSNVFSEDVYLNEIIKTKVHYKLAILGALGDNPMSSDKNDTGYLCDLADQFKDRLIEDGFDKELGKYMVLNDRVSTLDRDEDQLKQAIGLNSKIMGEIDLNSKFFRDLPSSYEKYLHMPLSELMRLTRFNSSHKYKIPPSFIYQNKTKFFNYLLPISWIPLTPAKNLRYLHKNLSMDIVNNDDGYSTIILSSNQNLDKIDENIMKQYFNFITDKPILPSTGIFYYEIEVYQEITASTDFKPIILINDHSMSSGSTSHISAGFCKKLITFETHTTVPNTFNNLNRLDLEKIRNDILCNEKVISDDLQNTEIETLLTSKPGEFRGSFAVNFEDLSFYNSVKSSQWMQRSTTIMNRKSENGKIDVGVPFKTQINQDNELKKIYKTDVVGCGINFIDQSIFITLNGVLAKVISKDELDSTNPVADKLFYDSKEAGNEISVFPIIGFEINNLTNIQSGDPSICKIKTNLGFKEFKFSISNYTKAFKNENQKYLTLLDTDTKPGHTSSDSLNLNLNNNPISLNELVKGYLNHEGYIDTFKAFNGDLENLAADTKDTNKQSTNDSTILTKTHASNRQLIKKYMLTYQFDHLFKFLSINYSKIITSNKGKKLVYKLKLLQLTYKIRECIENKLRSENYEFEFERSGINSESNLYGEAFESCKKLRSEYKDPSKMEEIDELASFLLISDVSELKKLKFTNNLFKNFNRELKTQLSELNNLILQSLGFKNESNLEMIFNNVSKNIKKLSLDYNDDKFMLVNFEKDHMDL